MMGLNIGQVTTTPPNKPPVTTPSSTVEPSQSTQVAVVAEPKVIKAVTSEFYSEYGGSQLIMFSGAEIRAVANIGLSTIVLNTLTTISYSTFREKREVVTLGNSNPRGRSRGGRTIGGTMIFAVPDEHPLLPLLRTGQVRTTFSGAFIPDELIPFDLSLVFIKHHPVGDGVSVSGMILRGVEFVTEASTFSINQGATELVAQFVANRLEPMININSSLPGHALMEQVSRLTPEIEDEIKQSPTRDIGDFQPINPTSLGNAETQGIV